MPRVAEMARITTTEFAPESNNIRDMAKLVHAAMLREAKEKGGRMAPHREDGTQGFHLRGALSRIAISLWPEVFRDLDKEDRDVILDPIRMYLRATKNAECIVTRDHSQHPPLPIWWVASIWNPVEILLVHRHGRREDSIDLLSKRLTPEEAGETREAEPVDVRLIPKRRKTSDEETASPIAEEPDMTPGEAARQQAFNAHVERMKAEYQAKLECIVELLDETDQPLTIDEIAHAIGVKSSGLNSALNDLFAQGRIFKRTETADERRLRAGGQTLAARRSNLYSTVREVPPRTERVAVEGFIQQPSPPRVSTGEARSIVLGRLERADDGMASGQTLARAVTNATGMTSKNAYKLLRDMVSDGSIRIAQNQRDRNHSHYALPSTSATTPQPAAASTRADSAVAQEIVSYMRRGWNPQKDRSSVVFTVRKELGVDAEAVSHEFDNLVADGTIKQVRTRVTGQNRTRFVLAEAQTAAPVAAPVRTPISNEPRVRQIIVEKFQRGARTKQFSAATKIARRFMSKRDASDLVEEMIRDRIFDVSWKESTNGGGRTRMLTLSSDAAPAQQPSLAVPTSFPPDNVTPAPAAAPATAALNGIDAAMETLKAAIVQTAAALNADAQSELEQLRADNARMRENQDRLRQALLGED